MTDAPAKVNYVGPPAVFILDQFADTLHRAFPCSQAYQVGSSAERPDFRDVDVRLMVPDADFERLFGDARHAQHNALWALICVSVSEHMSRLTGLPIDFQIQDHTFANKTTSGRPRHPIGIWIRDGKPDPIIPYDD